VNDFCLIESGEDEKWQGQVKTRARNNHRETRRDRFRATRRV